MGGRVSKGDPRIAAIGDVDELNSAIGLALSFQKEKDIINILENVQDKLFTLGAELAVTKKIKPRAKINSNDIEELEIIIDSFDIGEIHKFILPNGTGASASLHLARAIARRAERTLVVLSKKEKLNQQAIIYLNRLSSLLFVLAIYINRKEGGKEKNPSYS